jgi:ATP-binding cassette subfamily B (MDR/TAP) protein 1
VHSAPTLVQSVIKDSDDVCTLISVVVRQCLVVATMLRVGLIWALVRGWQLMLVGFAIAPVFVGAMALQTMLIAEFEARIKWARENVRKIYYELLICRLFPLPLLRILLGHCQRLWHLLHQTGAHFLQAN